MHAACSTHRLVTVTPFNENNKEVRLCCFHTSFDSGIQHCGRTLVSPQKRSCLAFPAGCYIFAPSSQSLRKSLWPIRYITARSHAAQHVCAARSSVFVQILDLCIHPIHVCVSMEKPPHWSVFFSDVMLSKQNGLKINTWSQKLPCTLKN